MDIIKQLSQKTLWAILIVISIASIIYCALAKTNRPVTQKKGMFVVTTAEISSKGVLEIYSAMTKVGHDVKIGFLPRDLNNGTIISPDTDFAAKFPSEDVLYFYRTKDEQYNHRANILPESWHDYRADYLFRIPITRNCITP